MKAGWLERWFEPCPTLRYSIKKEGREEEWAVGETWFRFSIAADNDGLTIADGLLLQRENGYLAEIIEYRWNEVDNWQVLEQQGEKL